MEPEEQRPCRSMEAATSSGCSTSMGSGLEQGSGPEQGSTLPEWRFLLLGKPGAGKSATGNSILGKAAFQAKFSAGPLVTRECRREHGDGPVKGRQLVVVDTPALFSPRVGAEDRRGHLQRCKELCAGGVHALLLVIPIGRFEAEDRETARRAWEAFGVETRERTVVVFTRKDELGEESELEDYIESHPDLRELVVSCGGRCCAFSNKGSAEERAGQRGALLREVQALLGDKDQPYCLQVGGPPGQLQDSEMEVAAQPGDNLQGLQAAGSEAVGPEELRVLLVGKRGAGKSTAGNRLLCRRAFEARFSDQPVTRWCESERRVWEDRDVLVIDAPDIAACRDLRDIRAQLLRLSFPGPHALLLVTPLGSFSQHDEAVLATLRRWFGDTFPEFLFVLFTREEDLGGQDPAAFLESGGAALHPVVKQCRDRWVFPDDKAVGAAAERQADQLLRRIAAVVELNGHRPCSFMGTGKPLPRPRGPKPPETLSLVLVGRSGTGKSATGNSILGWSRFRSELRAQPVTTTCRKGERVWGRQKVIVVDTPCLPQMLEAPGGASEVEGEVRRWLELCEDGQKVLVLVFLLGRFTQQDEKVLPALEAIFGKEVSDYVIVLFTRKEDLGDGTIEAYVRNTDNKALRDIMDKCGGRVWAFSNKETGRAGATQVRHLLSMANGLLWECGGRGYPHPWETVSGNIRRALEKPKHSSWIPEFIYNYYVTPSSDRAEGAGGATMERQPMTQGLEEQVCLTCEAPGQARQAGVEGRGLGREGETEVRKLETPEAALGSALSPQVLVSHGDSWCQDVAGTQ